MREILRIEQLYVRSQGYYVLEDFSMQALAGEFVFLCDPEHHGTEALVKLFLGRQDIFSGRVYLGGRPLAVGRDFSYELAGIYVIAMEESMQPYMTVAENLFLSWKPGMFLPWPSQKKLNVQARRILEHLGIEISPGMLVRDISYEDRQLLKLARAYCKDAKLILVDSMMDVVSATKQDQLLRIMDIMRSEGMAVICASQRFSPLMDRADKVMLFKGSRKIWTMLSPDIHRQAIMKIYSSQLKGAFGPPGGTAGETMLELMRDNRSVFKADAGRCIGIYAEKRETLDLMSWYMVGERKVAGLEMLLFGQPYAPADYCSSVRHGICIVELPYFFRNFSENISAEENVYLPDMKKMRRFGIFKNQRYERFLKYELERQVQEQAPQNREDMAWNILFTRLILGSARIVLCLGSFPWKCWTGHYDSICRFLQSGKTFIFLSVNINELSAVCHEIYNCENILP